jgi:hypothetical protein
MKRLLRVGVGLAMLGTVLWALKIAWAVPFDGQAVPDAKRLGELLKRPPGERQISAEEVQRYLGLLAAPAGSEEGGTSHRRVCAMLLLAYATDAPSLEALRKEAAGAESGGLLAGVAAYAVILREHRACSEEDLLGVLCYHLGLSKNPWTRMYLANRLWSDYGAKAEWAIYEAAKTETNMLVKADLLYYVSRTKNVALARAAVASDWSACGDIPEDYAYLLSLITPGRTTRYEHMLRIALVQALARTAGAAPEAPSAPKPRE